MTKNGKPDLNETSLTHSACLKCGGEIQSALSTTVLCLECESGTDRMKAILKASGLTVLSAVFCVAFFVVAVALNSMSADKYDGTYVGTGIHPGVPLWWASFLFAGFSLIFGFGGFSIFKGRISGIIATASGLAMIIGAYWLYGRSIVISGDEYGGRFMAYFIIAGIVTLFYGLAHIFPALYNIAFPAPSDDK